MRDGVGERACDRTEAALINMAHPIDTEVEVSVWLQVLQGGASLRPVGMKEQRGYEAIVRMFYTIPNICFTVRSQAVIGLDGYRRLTEIG